MQDITGMSGSERISFVRFNVFNGIHLNLPAAGTFAGPYF